MPTIDQLEERLMHRLGLAVTVALGTSRITEAINAGISRAYADGVVGPGVKTIVGYVHGTLSTTVSSHTANTANVTLADTTGVFPLDILEISGRKYLVHSLNRATGVVSLGIPVLAAIPPTTAVTITRRALKLPEAGQVLSVGLIGNSDNWSLEPNHRSFLLEGTDTGASTSRFYAVGYAENSSETYVSLSPPPSSETPVSVHYLGTKESLSGSTDIFIPEVIADSVLERARKAYLDWSGAIDQMEVVTAEQAARDTKGAEKTVGAAGRAARVRA